VFIKRANPKGEDMIAGKIHFEIISMANKERHLMEGIGG
jgi:hypothetical protein